MLVAIGGNSLIESPDRASVEDQFQAIGDTSEHLADLVATGCGLLVTHGNGPQVGFMLRRSELARGVVHEVPLDLIDADTQGAIGYMIQQSLGNALRRRALDDRVVTVVTQVAVDREDPAFHDPSKPIGSFYSEVEAQHQIYELGWNMVKEPGRGWRRVVPSPRPLRILETWAMQHLLESGAVVIGCGGGGIPVVETDDGYRGVPAVIDKDRASALLALEVGADLLVFSTGVPQLFVDFAGPSQRALDRISAADARRYLESGEFPAGSMGPKIEGALTFLEGGGSRVAITNPANLPGAFRGDAGTEIVP